MRAYRKPDDRYEFKLDSSRLALLGVGAGLVLLLVFLLGMLMGRGVWGGKRTPPIALTETPRDATPPSDVVPEPKAKLTFYEDLKKPAARPSPIVGSRPPRASQTGPPSSEPRTATSAPESETAPKPPPAAVTSETRRAPAKEKKPAPGLAPQDQPKAKLPAPMFTVQVGSFRDRAAAEDHARQVAALQVSAQVVRASVAGRTWYRVQVGRFKSRSEAEARYRSRLKPRGIQGFVTVR
jgi:DedD protein